MATRITMPQLGESVVEGTIARWLKREGEPIEKYEPLLEVITEKVNVEVPSPAAGTVSRLLASEGQTVAVGTEIAVIEDAAVAGMSADRAPELAGVVSNGSMPVGGQPLGLAEHRPEPHATHGNGNGNGNDRSQRTQTSGDWARRRYTPVVMRMAENYDLDLALVSGTGMNGRVTKDDVLRHLEQRGSPGRMPGAGPTVPAAEQGGAQPAQWVETPSPAAQNAVAWQPSPAAQQTPASTLLRPNEEIVPLTPMRRAIAENMQRSASTIPAAWTMLEVDVTGLVRLRERIKRDFTARHGVDLTYLPFILQAVVGALREYPAVNSVWGGDHILLKKQVNVGIAVSVKDGLLVPVIRDADGMNLTGLARACADLIARGRENRLTVPDMQGATFTVNNPGTFGSIASQPIIPPGQAAILNAEAIVKRPVVHDDAIAVRSMVNLCLSFDHRILDGREAIGFLQAVRQRLEDWTAESRVE